MAPEKSTRERKRELSATLAACRREVRPPGLPLRGGIRPMGRVRSALGAKPLKIFGATFVGATVLTMVLRSRRGRTKGARSSSNLMFRWILGISQPAVKLWILHKAKEQFLNTSQAEVPESLPRR